MNGKASAQKSSGYGYTPEAPIKVGGGTRGEREYLKGLRGPKGEQVRYERRGSCSGPDFVGGLLDIYEVTYDGLQRPVTLYLDMYHREDDPSAPVGFRLG